MQQQQQTASISAYLLRLSIHTFSYSTFVYANRKLHLPYGYVEAQVTSAMLFFMPRDPDSSLRSKLSLFHSSSYSQLIRKNQSLPLPAVLASEPVLEYRQMNDAMPCRVSTRLSAARELVTARSALVRVILDSLSMESRIFC